MLAPRRLPAEYEAWNRRWHAPGGRSPLPWPLANKTAGIRFRGAFAWQCNSSTRAFEYPWAHAQIEAHGRQLQVVEIGGSLSGLQFVLASEGHKVTNVDPGLAAAGKGWNLDARLHQQLCGAFRAPVRLVPATVDQAALEPQSADVVLCVSALEHFAPQEVEALAQALPRLLKPDGVLVMTVDLFLDLVPFSDRPTNRWGRNVNLREFLQRASLQLCSGTPAELCGWPEFDPRAVLANLADYLISTDYPCLSQCFVARLVTGS